MLFVVSNLVAAKLSHAEVKIQIEQEKAEIEARHQSRLDELARLIQMGEGGLQVWAEQHPEEFDGKKSIDLPQARFGFRTTPHSVEKAKGVRTWDDVVARLISTLLTEDGTDNSPFIFEGEDYVRYPSPAVDKLKLLADRENIPAAALKAAGIVFNQDELFFFEPKSEVLQSSTQEAA
jgi:hypothetical protein